MPRTVEDVRTTLAAVTLAALAVAPAAGAPTLPRLRLSSHAPRQPERLVVTGTQCPPNGDEAAYAVWLVSGGGRRGPDLAPKPDASGTWESVHLMRDVPAGPYRLRARCLTADAAYPEERLMVPPPHSGRGSGATVSDRTVMPGQTITISGSGFAEDPASFDVSVFWDGTYLKSVQVSPTMTVPVTIPAGAAPGRYKLWIEGPGKEDSGHAVNAPGAIVTVLGPDGKIVPPSSSPRPTAAPSSTPTPVPTAAPLAADEDGTPFGLVAALLLAAGVAGGSLLLVRRRRSAN